MFELSNLWWVFFFFCPNWMFGHRQCNLLQVAVFYLFINCVPEHSKLYVNIWSSCTNRGKKRSKICISHLWRDSHLTYHWHSNHKCLISLSARDGTGLNRFIASVALLWTTNITLKCFSDPACFNQMQRVIFSLPQLHHFITVLVCTCWFYQHFFNSSSWCFLSFVLDSW